MRAINHSLAGAAIGLAVGNPAIAAPAAFVSHFALDAIPHHGSKTKILHTARFRNVLLVDAFLCVALVLALAIIQPRHWLLAIICAFLAASPDFMWIGKFIHARKEKEIKPNKSLAARFHGKIQWFERPVGVIVEVVWLFAMVEVIHAMTG
jgi:hypothetical protein